MKVNKYNRLVEDEDGRRVLLAELQELSKNRTAHEPIGGIIPALLEHLKSTPDLEILRAGTEILGNIIKRPAPGEPGQEEGEELVPDHVPLVNTEEITRSSANMEILFQCLSNKDCFVRLNICKIFDHLIENGKLPQLQSEVLQCRGVQLLMDTLCDPRPFVRNECLLLMIGLCQQNEELQKLSVFESAFETLFKIVKEEGGNQGGIVVKDALQFMKTLLKGNKLNIIQFREIGGLRELLPLLDLEPSDMWMMTDDKEHILVFTLQVIRHLLPLNSAEIKQSQIAMHKLKGSERILNLALGRIMSLRVRVAAIQVLGDLLVDPSGSVDHPVRSWLATATLQVSRSEAEGSGSVQVSALQRLATVLLESQEMDERLACLTVFRSYLHANNEGQMALATTFTPSPDDVQESLGNMHDATHRTKSIGRQLLTSLLGYQSGASGREQALQSLLAAMVLAEILKTDDSKAFALQIPLHLGAETPVTLMSRLTDMLSSLCSHKNGKGKTDPNSDRLVCLAVLSLLCTWLLNCPAAVQRFTSDPRTIPALIELTTHPLPRLADVHIQGTAALLIAMCLVWNSNDDSHPYSTEKLQGLILSRVTKEKFIGVLNKVRKTREFTLAEQEEEDEESNLMIEESVSDQDLWAPLGRGLYDMDYTDMFKDTQDAVTKQLRARGGKHHRHPSATGGSPSRASTPNSNLRQASVDEATIEEYSKQIDLYRSMMEDAEEQVQQAAATCELLKRQLAEEQDSVPPELDDWSLQRVAEEYKAMYDRQVRTCELQQEQLQSLAASHEALEARLRAAAKGEGSTSVADRSTEEEAERLREAVKGLEKENTLLRTANAELKSLASSSDREHVSRLEQKLAETEAKYKALEAEQDELLLCLVKEELETTKLKELVAELQSHVQKNGGHALEDMV